MENDAGKFDKQAVKDKDEGKGRKKRFRMAIMMRYALEDMTGFLNSTHKQLGEKLGISARMVEKYLADPDYWAMFKAEARPHWNKHMSASFHMLLAETLKGNLVAFNILRNTFGGFEETARNELQPDQDIHVVVNLGEDKGEIDLSRHADLDNGTGGSAEELEEVQRDSSGEEMGQDLDSSPDDHRKDD